MTINFYRQPHQVHSLAPWAFFAPTGVTRVSDNMCFLIIHVVKSSGCTADHGQSNLDLLTIRIGFGGLKTTRL